jgi:hypothetical protein
MLGSPDSTAGQEFLRPRTKRQEHRQGQANRWGQAIERAKPHCCGIPGEATSLPATALPHFSACLPTTAMLQLWTSPQSNLTRKRWATIARCFQGGIMGECSCCSRGIGYRRSWAAFPLYSCFCLLNPRSGITGARHGSTSNFFFYFFRVQGLSNQRIGPENAIPKGLQTGPLPRHPFSSPLQNFFPSARQQLQFQNAVPSLQRKKTLAAWTGAPALTGRSSGEVADEVQQSST